MATTSSTYKLIAVIVVVAIAVGVLCLSLLAMRHSANNPSELLAGSPPDVKPPPPASTELHANVLSVGNGSFY